MTVKDIARQIIDSLPEDASLDDIMQALYLNTKFRKGEQEIRDGQGISHEEAKAQIRKWLE